MRRCQEDKLYIIYAIKKLESLEKFLVFGKKVNR